jgi:hypothetical protein
MDRKKSAEARRDFIRREGLDIIGDRVRDSSELRLPSNLRSVEISGT